MTALLQVPDWVNGPIRRAHGFDDDFNHVVTGDTWTTLVADTTPTVTVGDAAGGIVALYTDTTDNNEVALRTTKELFKCATGKNIYAGWYAQYTEANTDDANIFMGFMSALAANSLQDNGAGLRASGSIIGFYKVDGGTRWQIAFRDGSNLTTVDLTAANTLTKQAYTAGGASYQLFEIEVDAKSATEHAVAFKIDGVTVYKMSGLSIASATEMNFGFYAKTGGSQAETLNIDYAAVYQGR